MNNYQKSQEITLRNLTPEDVDEFLLWATDEEVTKYMMWDTYTSREEAEVFLKNVVEPHLWFKAICLDGKVIGSISLDKGKGHYRCKAELGYVMAKKYWGKGHVTNAVGIALEMAFDELKIDRIEAYVDPDNVGSCKVLEKNGFSREGLLKNFVLHKGVLKDRYIYSYLKPKIE